MPEPPGLPEVLNLSKKLSRMSAGTTPWLVMATLPRSSASRSSMVMALPSGAASMAFLSRLLNSE